MLTHESTPSFDVDVLEFIVHHFNGPFDSAVFSSISHKHTTLVDIVMHFFSSDNTKLCFEEEV